MRAAAVAASAAVVSSLAAGCGPQPVETQEPEPPAEIQQARPEETQEQRDDDRDAPGPPPTAAGISLLDGQCTCVSEQKNQDGTPVSTSPCMCVSHMMCTATTGMWLCPEGHVQQIASPPVPGEDTDP